ncbi:MAG: hypothetical protein ACP5VR_11520 [Acidimicrobiales bacterium]
MTRPNPLAHYGAENGASKDGDSSFDREAASHRPSPGTATAIAEVA